MLHLTPSDCNVHDKRFREALALVERRHELLREQPAPPWIAPVWLSAPPSSSGFALRLARIALVRRVLLRPAT